MELVRRVVLLSSFVALIQCALNTPEELRLGREMFEEWRSWTKENRNPGDRVFGGFATYVSLYPFAVFYVAKEPSRYWMCSGSILAPQWVLSVAHCMGLTKFWSAVFFAGDVDFSTDRVFTKYNIQMRLLKEAYQYKVNDSYHHDIVLLKPVRAFYIESGFVETIPITDQEEYSRDFKETCTVVGFGLRGKDLEPPLGIQRAASFVMEPGWKCGVFGIGKNGLCTLDVKTKSVCSGDSGGPIFCAGRFIQFGVIVGAQYENCTYWYCGAPVKWNIHMFVGFYREWIINTMHINPGTRSATSHRRPAALLVTLLLVRFLLVGLSP